MEEQQQPRHASTRRVYVEVSLYTSSVADCNDVRAHVQTYLEKRHGIFTTGLIAFGDSEYLQQHVERIEITDIAEEENDLENGASEENEDQDGFPPLDDGPSDVGVAPWEAELVIQVFRLNDEPPVDETAEDDENVTTCQQLLLPAASLHGLWESLIYDSHVKRTVLDYTTTAMLFSDAHVNPHIISWNRVVLLHGPPGTGKTSLCKALAHKLSIRLSDRFPTAYLVEINAHSLFSKWFSESGKLVMKLFRQIQELVEDPDALVCVLIDEVESLTAARKAAINGSEPSDAIRVVNAVLTQLDSLKNFANVLVLTTSNITEAIDVAFVDRADIKQYIGLPSAHARYEILRSCVDELSRVDLIRSEANALLSFTEIARRRASKKRLADQMGSTDGEADMLLSSALLRVAESLDGFSGRSLRKLPFQAHAYFVQKRKVGIKEFIQQLSKAAQLEKEHKKMIASG
ncbi:hypothetical protein PINS_up000946 [Pythium insidiosum]|nr:hypothetical protein PINS_up000946 [Pythium insidiosum]